MIAVELVKEHIVKRFTRSKHWYRTRKNYLKLFPTCAVCGRKKFLSVHHIKDFSTYPELELDVNNLITLCMKKCHLLFGHLNYWKSINPDVEKDAKIWKEKIKKRRK